MVSFNRFASTIARFSRWAIAAILCTLMFVVNIQPAAALGSSSSEPSDGIVQLDEIEKKAQEVIQEGPRGMDKVTTRAKGGLNGVQGRASSAKMGTPNNSADATTIADDIKDAIQEMKS